MRLARFTETGELKSEAEGGKNPFESPVMQTIFTVLRYVLFLALYVRIPRAPRMTQGKLTARAFSKVLGELLRRH